jgi:hypothetical protein
MKSVINLLPAAYRRQRMLRCRAAQWTTVVCVVLLVVWAARWYRLREYYALSQQLEAVAREGRPAQAMLTEITHMRQQLRQLQQQETVAKELERQRQVLTMLGLISQAAQQSDGKLRVSQFEVLNLQMSAAEGQLRNNDSRLGALTLVGVSLDSPTVAELHDALVRSSLFADVKLIKSNEREGNGVALYDYEVRCEL